MLWSVRKATAEDIAYLAPRLRQQDEQECNAATGMSTYDALMYGLGGASVVLGSDGKPIAIYGVERLTGVTGAVWMAATPTLTQPPYITEFVKQSRVMCDRLNEEYPLLCNVVDERNALHIRWLEWCGFIFINRHPNFGPEKRPFLEFIRINMNV